MTEVFLTEALAEFVQKALGAQAVGTRKRSTQLPQGSLFTPSLADKAQDGPAAEEEIVSQVQVYGGFLPPKTAEDGDLPFVYIRPVSGKVEAGKTTVEVVITVGVYAQDMKGYLDALNVYRRISSALTSLKSNRLADKYERATELTWNWAQEQNNPYWGVDITTTWYIYTDRPLGEEFI
ncbi:MAG: hypothetical protein IJ228_00655 [Succinivibrio sp.]|nr:hypothetical protein [Succinivibrio sp.]